MFNVKKMGLKPINQIILIIFLIISLMFGCNTNSKTGLNMGFAEGFYQKIKKKTSSFDVFYSVRAQARGINREDKTYLTTKFGFYLSDTLAGESNEATVMFFNKGIDTIELRDFRFKDEVHKYANYLQTSDSNAFMIMKDKAHKICELMDSLDVPKVNSKPSLGKFIIFTISPDYQLIYIPDTANVKHRYWKTFFRGDNKINDYWYYKRIDSNTLY